MAELEEELETLKAIFMEDLSCGEAEEDGGGRVVTFRIEGHHVLTLRISGSYPHTEPEIDLPDHLEGGLGLRKVLLAAARESTGSPVLFQVLDAAKEWVTSHPLSLLPHSPAKKTVGEGRDPGERAQEAICKFHLQGKCKFGDKCHNLHSSASQQQPNAQASILPEPSTSSHAHSTQAKRKELNVFHDSHSSNEVPATESKSKVRREGGGGRGGKVERSMVERDEQETKKQPMRQATDVISRILWDPDLPSEEFTVGYLDRFIGIMEKPFSAFSWEDLASVGANVLAVPKHRIQYFKYRTEIVWDKRSQVDNFFGSRGGTTIQEFISKTSAKSDGAQDMTKGGAEGCYVHPEEDLGSLTLESEEEVSATVGRVVIDRNRPTHFVCIHITNEEVKTNVQRIQDHVTGHTPQLAEGCLPTTVLHVTLCMVRLETEDQIEKAKQVLKGAQQQFIHILPRCTQLHFKGVDNFRERLVHVKIHPNPALDRFTFFLQDQFQKAGLKTPGNHDHYTPHMTIVKLSRPMQRQLHTSLINPAAYSIFKDADIGRQSITALHLCSMAAPKQEDGFYLRMEAVTNSLSGLTPDLTTLLLRRLQDLAKDGVLLDQERDQLVSNIKEGKHPEAESRFDAVIEELLRLNGEETMCSSPAISHRPPHVVILRGLPGSGKSFLARNCSENQRDSTKVAICGADEYFIEGDSYKFNPDLVPKAHTHCLGQFLHALASATKELVIVDNTNSKLWEYQIYLYVSEILGLNCHILEVPCPNVTIAEMYRSRNVHNIDQTVATKIFHRWEIDEKAAVVPPSLVYPRGRRPLTPMDFSLLSLCLQEDNPQSSISSLSSLTAVYTAIFLSTESQWELVANFPPNLPSVFASHVTLHFEPSSKEIVQAKIGRKVTLRVTGSAENGKAQAALVQLPKGESCGNDHPHVTISTEEGVSPKATNAMLKSQPVKAAYHHVCLEGIVGVVVRETSDRDRKGEKGETLEVSKLPTHTVTSDTDLHQHVLPKLFQVSRDTTSDQEFEPSVPELIDSEICTGHQKITQLFVFDFDGTLFNAPEPKEGRELYEKCTGKKWPLKGWLGWPESLLPPMKVRNGPALPEFRQHLGRAGSITLILTGRIERTRKALEFVLENNQVFPQRLILKPNAWSVTTPPFKAGIVRELLEEFPDVSLVKFWDDIADNLAAIHRVSKSTRGKRSVQFEVIDATRMLPTAAVSKQGKKAALQDQPVKAKAQPSEASSVLESYLSSCGLLPTPAYTLAATAGIEFLASQFAKAVEFSGPPSLLAYPFGSFPLGRQSDIDLCFLAPASLAPGQCMEKLASQLEHCGVSHIHIGHSTRCPRLKVMLQFPNTPAINYDVVFATIASEQFSSLVVGDTQPSPSVLPSLVQPGDTASKVALTGPLFLHRIKGNIAGVVGKQQFGAVVEMAVQVLVAHRQKGNAYHCMRTFHVVQLLSDFIEAHKADLPSQLSCDSLFKAFVDHVSTLPDSKLQKLFGEFVPREYIPRVMHIFSAASRETTYDDFPSLTCYQEMVDRSAPFPPEGYTPVELCLSGNKEILVWKLHTIIEARLPSYIRQLLSLGINVVPDGNTRNERKFVFAVPHSKSSKQTLQQVLRPFWTEIVEFRKQDGVNVELRFGQGADSAAQAEPTPGGVVEKIIQFHSNPPSSSSKVLHLPASLSSYERLLVHETAEQLGLRHSTVGEGKERHIIVARK